MAVSNAMQAYALSLGNQTLFAQMSTCHSKIYYAKNGNAISAAELGTMMKMMVGGKIKEMVDKLTDELEKGLNGQYIK